MSAIRRVFAAALGILTIGAGRGWAGPPFVTDDPEPVDYRHWEIDFFCMYNHTAGADSGQFPAIEVDYGALTDLQLHVIAPAAYSSPGQYGYGDTELGVKYRFIHETEVLPQIGVFPLAEVPTGDSGRGLGNGQTQIFVPVWLQKSFGKDKEWTTYGGGGFWYNPGRGNRNYLRFGWLLQRDFGEHITLGGEIYHETPSGRSGPTAQGHTAFNFGGNYNFNEHVHLLFSAGRDIQGANRFSSYFGFQWTI